MMLTSLLQFVHRQELRFMLYSGLMTKKYQTGTSQLSIYWHDYEAFGANARRDRASQFAGIRTDADLNEIDEPLVIYCQPAQDYLPHPQACLITGITPQLAQLRGLPEADFISRIHQRFSVPGTCGAGYNSIRYDDEMTRQLLYRNFYDPYEREWRHGNSRWDIIDMLRLCYAVRPEGIVWPLKEDGSPSFRLEELSKANHISHEDAHDALADVRATIAMARLVKSTHPKLYDYAFSLRAKHAALQALDVHAHKPVLHVSAMYSAEHGCAALCMPLTSHPTDKNGVLLYDLRVDPAPWLDLDEQALRDAMFTPARQRADGTLRLPVTTVHINRCPMLAPMAVMPDERMQALGIDKVAAGRHWDLIRNAPDFVDRVGRAVVSEHAPDVAPDPDFMLYSGGFFSDADKRVMQRIREMPAVELAEQTAALRGEFRDARLPEMLFRYRARNFPGTLTAAEQADWLEFRRQRLLNQSTDEEAEHVPAGLSVAGCRREIAALRSCSSDNTAHLALLDELERWVTDVANQLS